MLLLGLITDAASLIIIQVPPGRVAQSVVKVYLYSLELH